LLGCFSSAARLEDDIRLNASSVGAKKVNGPLPCIGTSRPAACSAWNSIENCPALCTVSTTSLPLVARPGFTSSGGRSLLGGSRFSRAGAPSTSASAALDAAGAAASTVAAPLEGSTAPASTAAPMTKNATIATHPRSPAVFKRKCPGKLPSPKSCKPSAEP